MLKEKIQQLARQYAPDFISIRHHLHAHPELSYQEFQTSKFVQQKLTEIGIPFEVMAGTGVVGLLKGRNPDKRVVALQQIISRNRNPLSPSVLSITSVQGGYTTNVIPSEVKLMGTFRAMDEEWRFRAHELIRKQATELVHSMGAEIDLHIDIGYPMVYNNESLDKVARAEAREFMGRDRVLETEIRMGAEDFGYYTRQIPGCFYRLGVMNEEKGITSGVHTPTFNIDESAIEIGAGMMAWMGAHVEFGR